MNTQRTELVWLPAILVGLLCVLGGCVGEPLEDHGGPIVPDVGETDTGSTQDISNVSCTSDEDCEALLTSGGGCQRSLCKEGKCESVSKASGSPCDADGDACTVDDACDDAGLCVPGSSTVCDDDEPCTADNCDPSTGACKFAAAVAGSSCDDGDPCTVNESCAKGKCQGGDVICTCSKTDVSKCWGELGLPQNDKCAGVFCKEVVNPKEGDAPFKCAINPSKAIKCSDADDTECLKNTCQSKTGQCAMQALKNGTKCDTGVTCLQSETCSEGKCVAASTSTCECTPKDISKCWTIIGLSEADAACAGSPYCADAYDTKTKKTTYSCKLNKASVKVCYSTKDTACIVNTCDTADGKCKLKPQKEGQTGCDDGNPCTTNDQCLKGTCVGTTNTCKCSKDSDCADQDDGDLCNGTVYCDKQNGSCKVNPATVVNCAALNDTACVVNFCFPTQGKCKLTPRENIKKVEIFTIEGTSPNTKKIKTAEKVFAYATKQTEVFCEDGNPCTVSEVCDKGTCKAEQQVCSCQKNSDCKSQEDGNLCNGTLYCDKLTGKCLVNPGTKIKCPTVGDTECAQNVCEKKSGKCISMPLLNDQPCDDGNFCTVGDACQSGVCKSGSPICLCAKNTDCAVYEDGNICNGTLYCDNTIKNKDGKIAPKCVVNPSTLVYCNPAFDTECLENQCIPKTGKCQMGVANQYEACDAGTPCAASPVCLGGQCSYSTNLCNCSKDSECQYITAGNKCLGIAFCNKTTTGGVCELSKQLIPTCFDDGSNPCALNRCDPATGKCAVKNQSNFTPCTDGNPCTVNDTCANGSCVSGTDVCQCTSDADCKPFDDNNLCNGSMFCDGGQCKPNPKTLPPPCPAPKATECIVQKCSPSTGKCEVQTDLQKCDDGNPCTIDVCETTTSPQKCEHSSVTPGVACITSVTGAGVCVSANQKLAVCQEPPLDNVVFVPAGDTAVGCNPKVETCSDKAESPVHVVKISGFWIQRFEVRVKDYKSCVDAGKCSAPQTSGACNYGVKGRDNHPVNCVSWNDAKNYCSFLAKDARLPREAEWSKAARGGCEFYVSDPCKDQVQTYVWGNEPTPDCNRAIHDDASQGLGCGTNSTAATGSLVGGDQSLYGVSDLGGNVSEWVLDYYSAGFFGTNAATTPDPTGPATGVNRVVRGGGWKSKAAGVRAAARMSQLPTTKAADIGFRCVVPL